MQKIKEWILAIPFAYNLVQWIFSSEKGMKKLLNYIDPKEGDTILDIGCGPANILEHFPDVTYFGFDMNEEYLEFAKKKYEKRNATFQCEVVSAMNLSEELKGRCDIVIATGVLHHLTDEEAADFFTLVNLALKKGGRIITIDPCLLPKQNPIAKFFVSNDRGRFVRSHQDYLTLFNTHLDGSIEDHIDNLNRLPYTHLIVTGEKG